MLKKLLLGELCNVPWKITWFSWCDNIALIFGSLEPAEILAVTARPSPLQNSGRPTILTNFIKLESKLINWAAINRAIYISINAKNEKWIYFESERINTWSPLLYTCHLFKMNALVSKRITKFKKVSFKLRFKHSLRCFDWKLFPWWP